jgi:hypothetical protein
MTLSSFVRELYRSASLSKVISWDTLYLVFKDRFLLQPNPDLDAPDSFQLPSGDVLSSQGNGDFNSSHSLCQARQSLMRLATSSCLRRRPFAAIADSILKRERHWMHPSGCRCLCF